MPESVLFDVLILTRTLMLITGGVQHSIPGCTDYREQEGQSGKFRVISSYPIIKPRQELSHLPESYRVPQWIQITKENKEKEKSKQKKE